MTWTSSTTQKPPGTRIPLAASLAVMLTAPLANATPLLPERIIDAPENTWVRLNDNLWPSVFPDASQAASFGHPRGVIRAWSSFGWDSTRGDVILWGGGHANYSGNEIYRWRSSTMNWERSSLPTAVTCSGANCRTVDGPTNSPISSHTYDNNGYLPIADRFITFGGNKYNLGGSFYMDGNPSGPYLWDPSLADGNKVGGLDGSNRDPSVQGGQMWENRGHWNSYSPYIQNALLMPTQDSAATTAITSIGGKDVIYQSRTRQLLKYTVNDVNDSAQDTWEVVWDGRWHEGMWGQGSAALNAEDELLIRTAGKKIYGFNLSPTTGHWPFLINPTDLTGRFPVDDLSLMGMDYDGVRDQFLLWQGLDEIWSLSKDLLGKWVIDSVTPDNLIGGNSPQDLPGFNGILGKWKYAQDWDIFIGLYDWLTGDVLAYKPTDWTPSASALGVPTTPPPEPEPSPTPIPTNPPYPKAPSGPNADRLLTLTAFAAGPTAALTTVPTPAPYLLLLGGLFLASRFQRRKRHGLAHFPNLRQS